MRFVSVGVLLIALFFFSGCQNDDHKVLSSGKMEDVLYDMTLSNAILTVSPAGSNRLGSYTADEVYNSVLKKYRISSKEFENSIYYYTQNPRKYEKIYVKIGKRLEKQMGKSSGLPHPMMNTSPPVSPFDRRPQ